MGSDIGATPANPLVDIGRLDDRMRPIPIHETIFGFVFLKSVERPGRLIEERKRRGEGSPAVVASKLRIRPWRLAVSHEKEKSEPLTRTCFVVPVIGPPPEGSMKIGLTSRRRPGSLRKNCC